MNILVPDSWLREYLDTKATARDIKEKLSLSGPSVERMNQSGNDMVYDIEITSNRVDMASVYGIAREAAAILPRLSIPAVLKPLSVAVPPNVEHPLPMNISDPEIICNRILGIVMEVEPMKPSPDYIRQRLEKSGVRSLNNLVDITNYVMLEVGHPTHVFDYDRVKTHTFIIRKAKQNEQIITLDGKKYLLSAEDVIIDDGTGRVIDLPGIMGTENSVVNQSTKRIIFFIESNNPNLIRKTSMRYGIRTMAATINEKHPDPETAKTAMMRGIFLFQQIAGGKPVGNLIDIYPNKTQPKNISVSTDFINSRLGIQLSGGEISEILQLLKFTVMETGNGSLNVTPPTYRQFDVTIPEDVVEEVARIFGYHNLPSLLMDGPIPLSKRPIILPFENKTKTILKYWGFTEVKNYSFISEELIKKSGLNVENHLKLANPLTEELTYMRINLIPSILENIKNNQGFSENLMLFELSHVYKPQKENLPEEKLMLAVTAQTDFFSMKGIAEQLLLELGIPDAIEEEDSSDQLFHPYQSVNYRKNGRRIGIAGRLHPEIQQKFTIKQITYLAYLDMSAITQLSSQLKKYHVITPFPPVIEDISLVHEPDIRMGKVMEFIKKSDPLIRNISYVIQYKNVTTLRLTFRSDEKGLTSEDIAPIREKIASMLKEKFRITVKS